MAEGDLQNDSFKVRLERASTINQSDKTERVVFDVTPDIVETRNVTYKSYDPVHLPGQIFVYGNTGARTWSVNGLKLISRTPREATLNVFRMQTLRSWCMPKFGATTVPTLGAPPAILLFSAYADAQHTANIWRVPTMIVNFSFSYPSEPDYMPTEKINDPHLQHIVAGTPFPAVTNVDLQLTESHSPTEYARFKLEDFKLGKLDFF